MLVPVCAHVVLRLARHGLRSLCPFASHFCSPPYTLPPPTRVPVAVDAIAHTLLSLKSANAKGFKSKPLPSIKVIAFAPQCFKRFCFVCACLCLSVSVLLCFCPRQTGTPRLRSPSTVLPHSHSHTHTHPLTHSLTHSLTRVHALTHSLTH